ncbi:hypothetical protein CONPUDRAFT_158792 [Coniophora puteana RWD-64-598 SS2]|uniref:Endonuclease/exonuclease/phosphatase domain-containing protein n=1 Tax=Coniophora puteana (strain RWD-64-598) TaxID=741705 RepID=A0A5M3MBK2_CONPW|nr:uncharacterized protein CONPUDRAFT_158792 [Coniophora puteana RWD-64-598 SS2]EIW76015.1 hypothetical protein CONPUDRAFT_158792 [Coniophora puteana RWD-64-598 SS2]
MERVEWEVEAAEEEDMAEEEETEVSTVSLQTTVQMRLMSALEAIKQLSIHHPYLDCITNAVTVLYETIVKTDTQTRIDPLDDLRAMLVSLSKKVDEMDCKSTPTHHQTYRHEEDQGPRNTKDAYATGPTYKPTTKAKPKPAQSPAQLTKRLPANPMTRHHPSHLVVSVQDENPPAQDEHPKKLVEKINKSLKEEGAKARIVRVHWNTKGNCIVFAHPSFNAEDLTPYSPLFGSILAGKSDFEAAPDTEWHKVLLHGMDTGVEAEGRLRTGDEVAARMREEDPLMENVKFVGAPKWLMQEAELREKRHSSVTITVKTRDNEEYLTKTKAGVFLYGKLARFAKFQDVKPLRQCVNCWSYEHYTSKCNAATTCRTHLNWGLERNHPIWSTDDRPAPQRTEDLVLWMMQNGFQLLNKKGEMTYFSHDGKSASVLDLMFANDKALDSQSLLDWGVCREKAYGSDHYALTWTINHGSVPIKNVTTQKYNWKDMEPGSIHAWKGTLAQELAQRAWAFEALRSQHTPLNQTLDIAMNEYHNTILAATKAHVLIWKDSQWAKPWWNSELEGVAKEIRDAQQAGAKHLEEQGELFKGITEDMKRLWNQFRQRVKVVKRKWLDTALAEATAEDVWTYAKWPKGRRTYQSPALD